MPVDGGGPDEYFITLAQFAGPRAGWDLGGEIPVHVPVILTDRLVRWIITPVDPENNIYRLVFIIISDLSGRFLKNMF